MTEASSPKRRSLYGRLPRPVRSGLTILALLAVYVAVPVPGRRSPMVVDWLLFAAGVAALASVIYSMVRREVNPDETGPRFEGLAALFYGVVVFYSLVYLALAARGGEFESLSNKVDSLYFTMATLTTVGYGDVHATGTAARVVVTTQLFFDLVFLGLVARLAGPALARSAARRHDGPPT